MAKNPKKPVAPTKKHLARMERERRQTRYIMIASAAVVLSVVLLIIYGILNQTILKEIRPVAIVNGDKIRTSLFEEQTRYARYVIIRNAENTYNMAQYFAQDPNLAANFVSQLQQVEAQLEPTTLGNQVMDSLIEDYMIRQEAQRRGITVSDQEIDQAFQAAFSFFPNGTPTPSPTFVELPTSTYSPLQLTLIPPTPTETVTPTVTATATLTPTVTASPSLTATATALLVSETLTGTQETAAAETIVPSDTPTPTATFTATPTATATSTETPTSTSTDTPTPAASPTASSTPTPFTTEGYATLVSNTFSQIKETYGISLETIRYVIESQLIRQKVMDAIEADLPATEEQVWALHILVEDENLAKDISTRLKEGEDWTLMAATYSKDDSNKNNSGDLGWFGRGQMAKEFEDAAFSMKVGETSDPVKTSFGWHIIRVLGHENRPLTGDQYQQQKQSKFDEWLKSQRESSNVEIRDWWVDIVPNTPTLPSEIQNFLQAMSQQSQPTQQPYP